MSFYRTGCTDCGSFNFVTVYCEGDIVCTGCGLVQAGCIVEDRAFYNPNCLSSGAPVDAVQLKQYNAEIDNKLKYFASHLRLNEHIEAEANTIFKAVRDKYSFRGAPLNCAIVGSIYIACNVQNTVGVSRDTKELCTAIGIDVQAFHKVLKHMYELLPEVHAQMQSVKEGDTLTRQIQSIDSIPLERTIEVAKEVRRLDSIRRNKLLLMGSPPVVVNAVLVFVACLTLKLKLHKTTYVAEVKVSRATLDKYVRLLREQSVY